MFFNLLALSAAILLNGRTADAQTAGSPCASVSSMSAAWISRFPEATQARVPAQQIEDCVKSIPIDVAEDQALIQELAYYVSWQSTIAYLKNPPESYKGEQVDIVGALTTISKDLADGKYDDEFSLQFDIQAAVKQTYDFHFEWKPDILGLFTFLRGNLGRGLQDEFALVSVSSDGKALPELYNYYDIIVSDDEGWTPSVIIEINNKTAEDFVQDWSTEFPYHEDHARYNRLFPNQAAASTGNNLNNFGRTTTPIGDYTTIKYKNGTVVNYLNSVNIGKNVWGDIRDGNDLWERFCNLGPPKQNSKKRNTDLDKYAPHPTKNQRGAALRDEQLRRSEASNVKRQNAMPTATGYPTPEILHSEAMIGGYFLSGNGYDDVAVLSIPTFMPKDDNATSEFQDTVGVFLKRASSAGKKKLIIDLRGNGGGRVFLGYDLFKQLFPSIEPYGATRFRANEAFNLAGQAMTEALANYTYEDALQYYKENGAKGLASQWKSIFNYRLPLSVTKENYTSWEEYFGPHEFNNDNFTTPSQWDLLNFFSDDFNMDVTGYRTRAGDLDTTQHFKADNIVLLQDGSCGSTCAVFSEMAKTQGHIQQVVVGGKPETGPMQGVAGTKGAQVWTISAVHEEAATALEALKDKTDQINNTDPYNTAWAGRPLMRTNYDDNGAATSRINLRDNIRANDTDEIPLEFTYEAADCRFFYTAAMVRDPVEVWKRAADARWGDVEKVCVEGSTGHPSSLSGAFAVGNNSTNTPNSTSTPNSKTGTGIRMGVDARLLTIIMVVFGVVAIF